MARTSEAKPRARARRGSGLLETPTLSLALIHRSACKVSSANFAITGFSEVTSHLCT